MQNKIQNNSPFQKRDKISKAALFIGLFLMIQNVAFSQTNGSVGIGTTATTPYANAVLDVSSTTKGVLLPRLTDAQRLTLTALLGATANGLIIYNTDTFKFNYWDGTKWNDVGAGAAGADGTVWYADQGSSLLADPVNGTINQYGKAGDFYLDGITGDVWKKNLNNKWVRFGVPNLINLKNTIKREFDVAAFNVPLGFSTKDFAFEDAVLGDAVLFSPSDGLPDGIIVTYSRVKSLKLVEVKFFNITQAAISVAATKFEIAVIK